MKYKLKIAYLYGDLMNIYGDTGNVVALQKRAGWRNIDIKVEIVTLGKKITEGEYDLYFFGGGQDLGQSIVAKDLWSSGKGEILKQGVEKGVPLLSICGGYQLLGEYYQPFDAAKLVGVGMFKAHTQASHSRMIGNMVIKSPLFGNLVGFENHSGKTYLKSGAQPLGLVRKGFGNNGEDGTEGCIYKNAIGCYMHGSLLPKNTHLADWLLEKALEIKYGKKVTLVPLEDSLENKAHDIAVKKFG